MSGIYDPGVIRGGCKRKYEYRSKDQVREIEIIGAVPDEWIYAILQHLEKKRIPFIDKDGNPIQKRYSPFRLELVFIPTSSGEQKPRVLAYIETEDGNLIHYWFELLLDLDFVTRYQVLKVQGKSVILRD